MTVEIYLSTHTRSNLISVFMNKNNYIYNKKINRSFHSFKCGDDLGTNVESWTSFVKYENFEDVNHYDPIFHHDDDDQCMTISHHDNSPLSSDLDSDTFFRHPRVPVATKPFLYLPKNNFFSLRPCSITKTKLIVEKIYLKGGKWRSQQSGKLVSQLPFEISQFCLLKSHTIAF